MQTQPTRDSSSRTGCSSTPSTPIRSLRHKGVIALMALALLTPAALVWAHPGGGGGGGHASAGGGSAGGGAHFGGGGGASFGGGAHFGGGGGASFGGGAHFSSAPHFSGGPRFSAPAPHFSAPAPHFSSPAPRYNAAAPNWNGTRGYPNHGPSYHSGTQGSVTARAGIAPRAPIGYGRFANGQGGQYGHGNGYGHGTGYVHGGYDHHWSGGYWHGHYWPPVYYRPGFVWFLPVLPAYCVTYWWGGIPYYYYDEAYYTWSPNDGGYEATEPPPVGDAPAADDGAPAAYPDAAPADQSDYGVTYGSPDPNAPNGDATDPNAGGYNGSPAYNGAGGSTGDNLYAYPKNGQSPEQQGQDRRECAEWASAQSPDAANSSSMDYKRALTACLSGRGYSVD